MERLCSELFHFPAYLKRGSSWFWKLERILQVQGQADDEVDANVGRVSGHEKRVALVRVPGHQQRTDGKHLREMTAFVETVYNLWQS